MKQVRMMMTLFCLLVLPGITAFSDIAENFKAGGVAFSGGGSFLYDGSVALDPANQFSYTSFSANVGVEFLAVDNLSISFIPSITTTKTHYDNNNVSGSLSFGAAADVTYYFLSGPNNPFVPAVGLGLGLVFIPGTDVMSGGITYTDQSLLIQPYLNLIFVLNWFLTQRTGLYLAFYPEVYMSVPVTGSNGNPVTDTRPFLNRLGFSATVGFGIRYFIPTRDKALIGF
jgi:hypothetical protein